MLVKVVATMSRSKYRQHPYTIQTCTNRLDKSAYRLVYVLCLVCLWILVSSLISGCATTQSIVNDPIVIDQLVAVLTKR
jgi:hypothetical protein